MGSRGEGHERHGRIFATTVGFVLLALAAACGDSTEWTRPQTVSGGEGPNVFVAEGAAAECNGSRFTPCVKACGEIVDHASAAAQCEGGRYQCPIELIPALACPEDAWSGSYAGCGPWVEGHDCFAKAVCDERFWTCPAVGSD